MCRLQKFVSAENRSQAPTTAITTTGQEPLMESGEC